MELLKCLLILIVFGLMFFIPAAVIPAGIASRKQSTWIWAAIEVASLAIVISISERSDWEAFVGITTAISVPVGLGVYFYTRGKIKNEIKKKAQVDVVSASNQPVSCSTSTSKPDSARNQTTPVEHQSPTGGIKIMKNTGDGNFRESSGDVADIAPLFSLAHSKYQRVMDAARSNSLTASHEQELLEAVDLITKVIELDGTHGVPYGLRGGLYMVFGQINRDRGYLEKAEDDYRKALGLSGSDPCNQANWRNSMVQIQMIKRMI